MAGNHRGPRRATERRSRVRYDKAVALAAAVGVTGFALVSGIGEATGTVTDDLGAASSRARPATSVDPVRASQRAQESAEQGALTSDETRLPSGSGSGRRVVFDMSAQRVWLVGQDDDVLRTYLVSGSVTDNLQAGHYAVYSRSRHAVGIDDSGTMEYFVRFTRGDNAAIGFHNIPVDEGRKVQTVAQLGTPTSHGCIRQKQADAKRMWGFADLGTKVDVVA